MVPQGMNPETLYLVNWGQGQVWIVMGIGKMIEKGGRHRELAVKYLQDNLKEVTAVCQSATNRWLIKTLSPPPVELTPYEDKVDYMTYYYDFFYNLETLLQLV